jgi:hypothetical protein
VCAFRLWRDGNDICAVLRYYAAYGGKIVSTFRDKLSLPSLRFLENAINSSLKMRLIGCPETSVQNHHPMLRNIPEEHRSVMRLFAMMS